jgi:hypothetical protein
MKYEVVEPYNHIRISLDWEAYAFELDFKGRFAPFNYANCLPSGDPMQIVDEFYGGHLEQAMDCTGSFEIRRGPAEGETRQIRCWSHRDHTWTSRFNEPQHWQVREQHVPAHFWPSVQLPDRHINIFGLYFQNQKPPTERSIGGFVSDKNGSRPLQNAVAEISPDDRTPAVRPTGPSSSGCAPRTTSRTAWTATRPSATSRWRRPARSARERPSTASCPSGRSGSCSLGTLVKKFSFARARGAQADSLSQGIGHSPQN